MRGRAVTIQKVCLRAGAGGLVVAFLIAAVAAVLPDRETSVVVGAPLVRTTVAAPGGVIPLPDPAASAPAPAAAAAVPGSGLGPLRGPDGRPYGNALAFRSNTPVPDHLVFALAVGSDARPGHDVLRSNGDSIHLLAVNPRTAEGTIVGFPRDAWVEVPGRGRHKLTSALALGGPQLMADTVRHLTGLPVHVWAVTAFEGLPRIVDDLGGVDIHVDRRMNDRASGARFEAGWHHFGGDQVLAFSRNRKDVPNGDFTRSENQGKVILAALAKLRAEVRDDAGLWRWIEILYRHARLDAAPSQLRPLAVAARALDPARVRNIVVPGRVGKAGSASVVYVAPEAAQLFEDLRADAVIGASTAPPPPPSTSPSTSSSTTSSTTSSSTTSTTNPPGPTTTTTTTGSSTSTPTSTTTTTRTAPPDPE